MNMKKIVGLVMVALLALMALPANAQLKFGIKGGVNISSVHFNSDVLKADNVTGFQVGSDDRDDLTVGGCRDRCGSVVFAKGFGNDLGWRGEDFDEDGLYRCSGQLEMEIRLTDRQGVSGSRSVYRFPCRR